MVRPSVLIVCLISALAFCSIEASSDTFTLSSGDFNIVQNSTELANKTNPASASIPSPVNINHQWGIRVPNDRVIGYAYNHSHGVNPAIYFKQYISFGTYFKPAILTCIEVTVEQDSPISQAAVVMGGVGKQSIGIELFARGVKYLKYEAIAYGLRHAD